MNGGAVEWLQCCSLEELVQAKANRPGARLVAGNTEVGIEMHIKGDRPAVLLDPTAVPELQELRHSDYGILVGGAVTLTRLLHTCQELAATEPAHRAAFLRQLCTQLHWFAGVQIRNVATLAGNIVTCSPVSDLNPIWVAMGTSFVLHSVSGSRQVEAKNFFKGYRKGDIRDDEVLVRVEVPWPGERDSVHVFKQAHRREDDIAIVNAAVRLRTSAPDAGECTIDSAWLVFGGVGPTVVRCDSTAEMLQGKPLTKDTAMEAARAAANEVAVPEGAPGGMAAFRNSLVMSFVYKACVAAALQLRSAAPQSPHCAGLEWVTEEESAVREVQRPPARGVQFHAEAEADAVVGQPVKHRAADLQVTGEAVYTEDAPLPEGTLHAALVTSRVPHGRIKSIDPSAAQEVAGVHGYFGAKDVPGCNRIGAVFLDEFVFAEDKVTCVGQPIGIVVAQTAAAAKRAAALVKVDIEALPSVMSIEAAIEAQSFHPQLDRTIEVGDVDAAFTGNDATVVVEGEARVGGQEHFYLEPHNCFVQPIENDEYLLVASTQDVSKHQKVVAGVLGVAQHKLISKTKRLGGGFGGKETRGEFLHCAAAVASFHTRRPVRLVLSRQDDMQMTGHRHAFLGRYKVAAAADGRLLALQLDLFSNAGNSVDLSHAVMDRALLHSDCTFHIPNMRIRGRLCQTNQASNTAFRGFGGPQGMLVASMWMDAVAHALGMPLHAVQERNLYGEGAVTHFGQPLVHNRLPACWQQVTEKSNYHVRRKEVGKFNAATRHRKRGLAILPTKFGISFTFKPMNQAGALVSIFLDGSVAVAHGGVEMGQGLHTKMCQVAAQALEVPLASVHVAETSTDKVPNASPTAASASSDLYGAAILDACHQLNERLAPIREKCGPVASMHDIAGAAWMERVDLCAHGFYRTPDITGAEGNMPFNYFVFGAAVSEVELDCLTGDWHCLRSDIVIDVGNPINPAIDIGQVEGGFVQGMGWACMEELRWGSDREHSWVRPGYLATNGPGAYKIPTANDIPLDLRVTLLDDAPNRRAVHSSKAVGEPPLHLGASVHFALKDAIYSCRKEAGLTGFFALDTPSTPERLRMACGGPLCVDPSGNTRPALSC
eukprot:jgi/Ulvmu1/5424/UM022_0219.1